MENFKDSNEPLLESRPVYQQEKHARSEENEQPAQECIPLHRLGRRETWIFAGMAILILFLVAALASVIHFSQGTASESSRHRVDIGTDEVHDCGHSPAEARAKGCHIEPMLYGWVPDACFYPSLSADFDALSDRQWYADINMTEPLTASQMWQAEIPHVFTHSYHAEHCLFLWRKLAWAVEKQVAWIDSKAMDIHHTNHCSDLVSHGSEDPNGVNDVVLGFYKCKRLRWAEN